ncbi:AfsR/SARP family transcriptional regulator [Streptomyces sp. NBC_01294]|uniref:AfsR/SARP family transcriptional regulator n=1 Tax=Streptomyces sp. NBC_01294 TaxID=2903815 RepID=UPI002DDBD11E|nr:BTAD domain-containing putative transcriptional regulator [Streptomyces sp. NBC_01294]WRZ59654.1 winged helix-turn-helix domain-containing protein [Streptomyces sp. NBC_01294]
MRYAILGTAQAIRDDGTPIAVGGARLRALLTALALRPGRAVPARMLVAEVWAGDPPADAVAALQALVARLRRTLGHAAVRSAEGGYQLAALREDVDLYRFERLARAAGEARDPAEAVALYEEALALWRGPALADLPDPAAESARWEAVRMDARRGRLAAALSLGDAERSLPELTALCARQPLDEPLQALRIRALRDVGRPAEALSAYDRVRRDLADRLGTTPGPALRALHTELLSPPPPVPPTAYRPTTPQTPGDRLPAAPASGARAPHAWEQPQPAGPAEGQGPSSGAAGQKPGPAALAPGTGASTDADPARPGPAPWDRLPAAGPAVGHGPFPGAPGPGAGAGTDTDPTGPNPRRHGAAEPAAPTSPGARPQSYPGGADAPWSGAQAPPAADPGHGPFSGAAGEYPGTGTAMAPDGSRWHAAAAPAPPGQGIGTGTGNLRARLTTFVGREDDIRVIGDDLARARLVTLLGPGGAGKTRLSQEAAEAHAARGGWPDGVWLVELAPVDDPEDVAEATLAALGARETKLRGAAAEELRALTDRNGDAPLDRLAEHCARQRMLLLLDNCEHVIGAAAELAEELLARCPGVQILATSREPLGVPGESLRPVEPLPDPVALRLLGDRGAAALPGFRTGDDPAAAAEICRRLDGLPLAIELAAARLRLLTPRQIADRLDDRFRLLTSGARTVLPRQQTLRAVVDWSWDLLDEPERTVLRRLSVFAGGCDLVAAEAVCADPAYDTADVLGSLVDKSLVVAAPGPDGSGMRYRLLETVGEYAAERLAAADGDREHTERRHLVHYRELARTTEPLLRGHGQRAATERLATEYENLRTALRRAVAARDGDEVLCLVHSLGWYWHMHDLSTESRHWSEAAAALGPNPFAAPAAPAEPVHGRIVDTPPPYSGELLTEAWRGIQLIRLAARDQNSATWDTPEVRAQIEGVLATYRPGLPQTCRTPSSLWIYAVMISGDVGLLQRVVDETVEACRAFGYRWELASALQLRANILANRADWAGDASRDADESLALFHELGDAWGCAEALSARAESREKRGMYAQAAEDFRAAIEHAERLGAKAQVTVLRVRMAGTLVENGEPEEAEEILTEITARVQRFGNEAMPAARMFLAGLLGRTGRIAEARAQIEALREDFALGAYAVFDVFLLATMAWLDNQEGLYEEALVRIREAMSRVHDPLVLMVAPQLPAVYLLTGAVSLVSVGCPRREHDAARLLGAYRALLPPGHFPVTTEREDFAHAEERARAALGDAAYEKAYAEGGGLSLEEATALI